MAQRCVARHNPHGSTIHVIAVTVNIHQWLIYMVAVNGLSPANSHCTMDVNLCDYLVITLGVISKFIKRLFAGLMVRILSCVNPY